MQSLKKIFINALLMSALLFGLTVSAMAKPTFEEVKVLAEKGDSYYQGYLGSYYDNGEGVQQDYVKAFYWYQRSANQGDKFSEFSVGHAYAEGEGVRQDYAKALQWYQKAANQNNSNAQGAIGDMYKLGHGVRQNKATAKEWYGKSCDNGNQEGCDFYRELNEQGY